ncbi:hypothetical protein BD779DRAFT_1477251 [Infundibulicybe gibba]|nr:hypothetical protein BD779DRAFT_1477251 [Infundibulicybe gibba]
MEEQGQKSRGGREKEEKGEREGKQNGSTFERKRGGRQNDDTFEQAIRPIGHCSDVTTRCAVVVQPGSLGKHLWQHEQITTSGPGSRKAEKEFRHSYISHLESTFNVAEVPTGDDLALVTEFQEPIPGLNLIPLLQCPACHIGFQGTKAQTSYRFHFRTQHIKREARYCALMDPISRWGYKPHTLTQSKKDSMHGKLGTFPCTNSQAGISVTYLMPADFVPTEEQLQNNHPSPPPLPPLERRLYRRHAAMLKGNKALVDLGWEAELGALELLPTATGLMPHKLELIHDLRSLVALPVQKGVYENPIRQMFEAGLGHLRTLTYDYLINARDWTHNTPTVQQFIGNGKSEIRYHRKETVHLYGNRLIRTICLLVRFVYHRNLNTPLYKGLPASFKSRMNSWKQEELWVFRLCSLLQALKTKEESLHDNNPLLLQRLHQLFIGFLEARGSDVDSIQSPMEQSLFLTALLPDGSFSEANNLTKLYAADQANYRRIFSHKIRLEFEDLIEFKIAAIPSNGTSNENNINNNPEDGEEINEEMEQISGDEEGRGSQGLMNLLH